MSRLGRGFPNNALTVAPVVPPVAYGATGSGNTSTTSPITYTDTIPAGTNYTLIWVSNVTSVSNPTITASVGAVSASLQQTLLAATITGQFVYLTCFSVPNPPSGSQTITFTSSNLIVAVVNTVHYKNVMSAATPIILGQQTGQPSISATGTNPKNMYANAFTYMGVNSGDTFSAYSQTQRFLQAQASGYPIIIGDAPGNNGTLTFSATRTTTTHTWGGIILPLLCL